MDCIFHIENKKKYSSPPAPIFHDFWGFLGSFRVIFYVNLKFKEGCRLSGSSCWKIHWWCYPCIFFTSGPIFHYFWGVLGSFRVIFYVIPKFKVGCRLSGSSCWKMLWWCNFCIFSPLDPFFMIFGGFRVI